MRRNRKNSIKKERIIMLASSAFVLAALTMTGVYMKEQNVESKDDGYTLDFTALEESADDKFEEIAKNNQQTDYSKEQIIHNNTNVTQEIQPEVTEDDLDYMPLEVGSGDVEIPGLTSSLETLEGADLLEAEEELLAEAETSEEDAENADKEASSQNAVVEKSLSFTEADGLLRPVSGEILMNYSMDASVYFETLAQYKYNPAVIFSATEGTTVNACAAGKVINVYEDAQIGKAVTLDLGNGYQATYGQLKDVNVSVDSYVEEGDLIGAIAAPTKYYTLEGSNLYFQLTKDGTPVNPEVMFR
ncbi:MAG: M23 family metallopeptidase [Lachnospiraceae bacterium]|nr:M23 family metallopeptidase [Lachnospiraceae bacterium]